MQPTSSSRPNGRTDFALPYLKSAYAMPRCVALLLAGRKTHIEITKECLSHALALA
jgi:hypothetical protein